MLARMLGGIVMTVAGAVKAGAADGEIYTLYRSSVSLPGTSLPLMRIYIAPLTRSRVAPITIRKIATSLPICFIANLASPPGLCCGERGTISEVMDCRTGLSSQGGAFANLKDKRVAIIMGVVHHQQPH